MHHQTEVVGIDSLDHWRAICLTCPWRGPRRDSEDRASIDTDWHRAHPTHQDLRAESMKRKASNTAAAEGAMSHGD